VGTNDVTKLHLGRTPLLKDASYQVPWYERRRQIAYAGMDNFFGLSATTGCIWSPSSHKKLQYFLREELSGSIAMTNTWLCCAVVPYSHTHCLSFLLEYARKWTLLKVAESILYTPTLNPYGGPCVGLMLRLYLICTSRPVS
jgi:hypothetical protein